MACRTAAETGAYLCPALRTLVIGGVAGPQPDLDHTTLAETKRAIARQFEILALRLSNRFMASEHPGAAD